jgi:hypothetical protein
MNQTVTGQTLAGVCAAVHSRAQIDQSCRTSINPVTMCRISVLRATALNPTRGSQGPMLYKNTPEPPFYQY